MQSLTELMDRLGGITSCDVAIHSPAQDDGKASRARPWEVIIQHHTSAETRIIAHGQSLEQAVTAALAQAQAIGLR
jgi:hypothetical protein